VKRMFLAPLTALGLLAFSPAVAQAPSPPGRPPITPVEMTRMRQLALAHAAMPDDPGTGPYPAIKEERPDFPGHVVYRPRDLAGLGRRRMPIYVFGNGACTGDGASARLHLLEIASHGYLVVAPGRILSGPGIPVPEAPTAHFNETTTEQLRAGIDWAIAENGRRGSPFFGRVDTAHIAVSGHSCGGLQALSLAGDSRVTTFVIMNSGIYNDQMPGRSGIQLSKTQLERLRAPILYVLGGPTDIAYGNGMDDYRRITGVPAVVANIPVGHGGTFWEPNGGRAARLVVDWLDWQLRGDRWAARAFAGEHCRYCTDADWRIDRKNMPAAGSR